MALVLLTYVNCVPSISKFILCIKVLVLQSNVGFTTLILPDYMCILIKKGK